MTFHDDRYRGPLKARHKEGRKDPHRIGTVTSIHCQKIRWWRFPNVYKNGHHMKGIGQQNCPNKSHRHHRRRRPIGWRSFFLCDCAIVPWARIPLLWNRVVKESCPNNRPHEQTCQRHDGKKEQVEHDR
eukprot:scaffold228208_cov63-Attheya_sp.AAC.1